MEVLVKIIAVLGALKQFAQLVPMQAQDKAHITSAIDELTKDLNDIAQLDSSALRGDANALWDFLSHGGNRHGTPESRAAEAAAAAQVVLHPVNEAQPAPLDPRDVEIASLRAQLADATRAPPVSPPAVLAPDVLAGQTQDPNAATHTG